MARARRSAGGERQATTTTAETLSSKEGTPTTIQPTPAVGFDRSCLADKSKKAEAAESEAIAAFERSRLSVQSSGEKTTTVVELLDPSKPHLTDRCWRAFSQHVRQFPGWTARRRAATPEEVAELNVRVKGTRYFISVAYDDHKTTTQTTAVSNATNDTNNVELFKQLHERTARKRKKESRDVEEASKAKGRKREQGDPVLANAETDDALKSENEALKSKLTTMEASLASVQHSHAAEAFNALMNLGSDDAAGQSMDVLRNLRNETDSLKQENTDLKAKIVEAGSAVDTLKKVKETLEAKLAVFLFVDERSSQEEPAGASSSADTLKLENTTKDNQIEALKANIASLEASLQHGDAEAGAQMATMETMEKMEKEKTALTAEMAAKLQLAGSEVEALKKENTTRGNQIEALKANIASLEASLQHGDAEIGAQMATMEKMEKEKTALTAEMAAKLQLAGSEVEALKKENATRENQIEALNAKIATMGDAVNEELKSENDEVLKAKMDTMEASLASPNPRAVALADSDVLRAENEALKAHMATTETSPASLEPSTVDASAKACPGLDVDTSKEENKVPKAADATVDASPASPQPGHAPVSQWKQLGPTLWVPSVTRLGFKPPLKESEAPKAKKANSPKGVTASFEAAGASMSEWFQGKV